MVSPSISTIYCHPMLTKYASLHILLVSCMHYLKKFDFQLPAHLLNPHPANCTAFEIVYCTRMSGSILFIHVSAELNIHMIPYVHLSLTLLHIHIFTSVCVHVLCRTCFVSLLVACMIFNMRSSWRWNARWRGLSDKCHSSVVNAVYCVAWSEWLVKLDNSPGLCSMVNLTNSW